MGGSRRRVTVLPGALEGPLQQMGREGRGEGDVRCYCKCLPYLRRLTATPSRSPFISPSGAQCHTRREAQPSQGRGRGEKQGRCGEGHVPPWGRPSALAYLTQGCQGGREVPASPPPALA